MKELIVANNLSRDDKINLLKIKRSIFTFPTTGIFSSTSFSNISRCCPVRIYAWYSSHVTHVEVKNPVGSDIEKASRNGYSDLVKQGNKIGDKLSKQQSKWSNATFRATLSNIDPNAAFPQSPANTLGLVDEFDVPISEKKIVQNAVENNCTNTSNVIFINNETNI